MEVIRSGNNHPTAPSDFRARQLSARAMLRGDLEGDDLERYVEERVLTTTLDKAVRWAQGNSMYPLTFGLACCAIEFMGHVASRVDVARFGISFYMIAMLFILFDIEVVFLYPIAVQLRAFGTFAMVETLVFIALLAVAFVYVWRRGALNWS